jgi:hypothetical protein
VISQLFFLEVQNDANAASIVSRAIARVLSLALALTHMPRRTGWASWASC